MEIKTAIVLASGLGRKVWPYGEFRQKCTIPVANTPIVRRVVENLIEVGCERIVVVVGHYAQQVRGALADIPNVVFVTQHPIDGTVSAVLRALAHVEDEPFLVVYGDIVTIPDNFRNIIRDFVPATRKRRHWFNRSAMKTQAIGYVAVLRQRKQKAKTSQNLPVLRDIRAGVPIGSVVFTLSLGRQSPTF